MIALALAWAGSGLVDGNSDERNRRVMGADTRSAGIGESPESHLERYLAAPFVLGEMPPTLLNAEQLSDGRYAVSYLRRIVEVKYYDSAADIPVDGEGNLVSSPREVQRYDARPTEEQAPKP